MVASGYTANNHGRTPIYPKFAEALKRNRRMKKTVIAVTALVTAYGVAAGLLPSQQVYSFQIPVPVPAAAIVRLLTDTASVAQWWPGERSAQGDLQWAQGTYRIREAFISHIEFTSLRNGIPATILFSAAAEQQESTLMTLSIKDSLTGNFLWKPLQQLTRMRQRGEHAALLDTLARYFSNPDRVYGYRIEAKLVPDASLISLRRGFDHYPTTVEVYAMVDEVKAWIAGQGGRETNLPMLHVYTSDATAFEAMVAIATDRELTGKDPFSLKRMLRNGKILVAEVRGGPEAVARCQEAMEHYVKDHRLLSPAMPFQRLVTDRRAESDSTRWVTAINYPIF